MRVVPLVWTKSVRKIDIFLFEKSSSESEEAHSIQFSYNIILFIHLYFLIILFADRMGLFYVKYFLYYYERENFLNQTLCTGNTDVDDWRRKIDDSIISTAKTCVYTQLF